MSEAPRSRCCAAVTESAPAVRPRRESWRRRTPAEDHTSRHLRTGGAVPSRTIRTTIRFSSCPDPQIVPVRSASSRARSSCARAVFPICDRSARADTAARGCRIERRRPLQLLDRLLGVTTPKQRLSELRTWARERRIQLDRGLERGDGFCALRCRSINAGAHRAMPSIYGTTASRAPALERPSLSKSTARPALPDCIHAIASATSGAGPPGPSLRAVSNSRSAASTRPFITSSTPRYV